MVESIFEIKTLRMTILLVDAVAMVPMALSSSSSSCSSSVHWDSVTAKSPMSFN